MLAIVGQATDTAPAIGDNSRTARAEYITRRREIWAARVPVAVKIIALAIIEHMNPENMECTASKARLAFMCNMPPKTFERHYNAAKALFHYHERKGKTTIFSPKLLSVASELARLWPADDASKKKAGRYAPSPNMREGQNDPPPNMTLPQKGQTPPQIDLHTPPQIGGPNRQRIDKLEEKEESASKKSKPYSQSFEDFWKQYPRREGKGKAYNAWKRLNGDDRKKARGQLDVQLPTLLKRLNDERGNFCPHAATWLGQRRFDDEPLRQPTSSPTALDRDIPDFMPRPREDA